MGSCNTMSHHSSCAVTSLCWVSWPDGFVKGRVQMSMSMSMILDLILTAQSCVTACEAKGKMNNGESIVNAGDVKEGSQIKPRAFCQRPGHGLCVADDILPDDPNILIQRSRLPLAINILIFSQSWGHLCMSFELLWSTLGSRPAMLGPSWGCCWGSCGLFGSTLCVSWIMFGLCWGYLGASGGFVINLFSKHKKHRPH